VEPQLQLWNTMVRVQQTDARNMRVCVTGATGFIGAALVRRLLQAGVSVRALARPSARADDLEARGVEVVRGDLNDAEAVARAVEGAEVVYHTAAMVEGPGSAKEFIETNVGGTQHVFEACIRKGVRHIVHISSIAVYGLVREGERISEGTPCDDSPEKRDSYAQSKIKADEYAMAISWKTKLAVTILRPGIVYGPGRPLPTALLGFRLDSRHVVFGRREQRFPLTYVENLVDAIELVGRETNGGLRQYIVIDDEHLTLGKYHSVREQVEKTRTLFLPGWLLLIGEIGREILVWFLTWGSTPDGVWRRQIRRGLQDRWYDTRRIREETGWAPKVPLRAAIEQTIRPALPGRGDAARRI